MTMLFTPENPRRFYASSGGGDQGGTFGNYTINNYGISNTSQVCLREEIQVEEGLGLITMADDHEDDDSKTDQSTNNFVVNDELQLATANSESSSKNIVINVPDDEEDINHHDQGWLQLSIGGGHHQLQKDDYTPPVELELLPIPSTSNNSSNSTHAHELLRSSTRANEFLTQFRSPRPPPLTNFPTTSTGSGFSTPPSSFFIQHPTGTTSNINYSNFHQQQQQQHLSDHHQIINWANFRPIPVNIGTGRTPFQLYPGLTVPNSNLDLRVIPPPKRPHSGLWFMLQASQNQEKQPFLPQVSKSYLRIKDGRMTIRLVMKYLVNKLTLQNESEIEIRCKGQKLVPFLTLQHVRDNIWSSTNRSSSSTSRDNNNLITLLPNSSTTEHIMVLHYARNTSST